MGSLPLMIEKWVLGVKAAHTGLPHGSDSIPTDQGVAPGPIDHGQTGQWVLSPTRRSVPAEKDACTRVERHERMADTDPARIRSIRRG
ncbi:hypothetical protein KKI24_13160 [bacterium]|nr:hypothetical protein [bacterium]